MTGEFVSNGALVVIMANALGTTLAGAIAGNASENVRLFLIPGFAAGLTTFSSLSFFIVELPPLEAAFFAGLNLFLSLSILGALRKSK